MHPPHRNQFVPSYPYRVPPLLTNTLSIRYAPRGEGGVDKVGNTGSLGRVQRNIDDGEREA
eukprot:733835-Hanusia_phi.AAC.1